jgi:nucleoside-diphosphate-sugar epimerase
MITGGAGFVGSHLAKTLLKEGNEVVIYDDVSTGNLNNLEEIRQDIHFVQASLLDKETLGSALKGVEKVFHAGAIPSVPRSIDQPEETHHANVTGTFNLLLACQEKSVKRIVYSASSSAYGDTPTLPKVETMPPSPQSYYALHKYIGEEYMRLFHKAAGLETVSIRYFNVFGPFQNPNSEYSAVIPKFICMMKKGDAPTIFGDGETSRDFSYIDNVVRANIMASDAGSKAFGRVMNVACGERVTLNELVGHINQILGKDLKPKYAETRRGDVKHSLADISLARELIGYEPSVFFQEGLKLTVDWFLEQEK